MNLILSLIFCLFDIRPQMWRVEFILGWIRKPEVFWWRVNRVSRQKSSAVFDTPSLNNGILFEPSPALPLTWQSSSPWDFGPTYSKDQFPYVPVIFYTKDCNSVDQSGSCRCERQLPLHYLESSSAVLPKTGLTAVLMGAPALQTHSYASLHGWIASLSSLWLFTWVSYSRKCLQHLSQNAKLISCLGFTTVSSSYRCAIFSEARVKWLKKSTVTATTT